MRAADPLPPTAPSTAWDDPLLQNPHAAADKRTRVQRMFAAIAPSDDLNNRLQSVWMDQAWRRRAVKLAELKWTDRVVDVACGTGDLALTFADSIASLYPHPFEYQDLADGQVTGVDFTFQMLPIAQRKSLARPELAHVNWINGDAQ